jgi:hypothetical protein
VSDRCRAGTSQFVIPAKAGSVYQQPNGWLSILTFAISLAQATAKWIPAFAGMTIHFFFYSKPTKTQELATTST